jgi:hypothetical protein
VQVHFLQIAYESMNDLLLNIICPLPLGARSSRHG